MKIWENKILVIYIQVIYVIHKQVLHFFLTKTEILFPSDFTHFMSNKLWFITYKKGDTLFIQS